MVVPAEGAIRIPGVILTLSHEATFMRKSHQKTHDGNQYEIGGMCPAFLVAEGTSEGLTSVWLTDDNIPRVSVQ